MQMNVENLGQLERRLNLALPAQQIESEVENRLKHLARTVKMDGFRPGKVPLKVVARQYGMRVRDEVLGEALNQGFTQAVREQNLKIAGDPRFDSKQPLAGAQQFEFTATFEVYPEVAVGDMAGKTFERPVIQVGNGDVDKTLEILRKQRVQYETASRKAKKGDRVTIDYRGTIDGQPFQGGEAQGYSLVLGESTLLKDFEKQITGMSAGEGKTFELSFPADYHGKEVAGKNATFELKVGEVAKPVLPEIDAEFAKSLGIQDGDLEKMRDEIKANLEREVARRVKAKLKDQVMQSFIDVTQIEVPKALMAMEVEKLMQQAGQEMASNGVNLQNVQLPADMFQDQAKRRVTLGLILAELIRTQSLAAKPDQVRAAVEEFAQSYEHPAEVVKWYYERAERLREVEALVMEDNVVAWALERGKVEDKPTGFDELMGNA
jgi:trigger factor